MNKLLIERFAITLNFDSPEIYVNLKSDGSFKDCVLTTLNVFRKKKVHKVPNEFYPLILRIYETYKERDIYRGSKKIAELYRLRGRKY